MSKEMREQINKVKNFGQFLNESKKPKDRFWYHITRDELFDKVERYYNEHQDGYVKLNFEIEHDGSKLHFNELYKRDGGIYGDDFEFYFKDENGKQSSWYLSRLDKEIIYDIVNKMVGG